jgi:energy-converting hydrogenase Eha subunit B
LSHLFLTIVIGIGATFVMDIWSVVRRLLFGVQFPNYRLVGRWIAHMAGGRFLHKSIAASPPLYGEVLIGWTAHYVIGIGFAGMLTAAYGMAWCREPTVAPALGVGLATVLAPFLIMQPGMGAGMAASRTANPTAARLQSLISHVVFGLGLYVSALAVSWLAP